MTLSELLKRWRESPSIAANIAAWHTLPARTAQTQPLPVDLHPDLLRLLHVSGIHRLYSHQAAAWTQVQAGRHPVVVTGTASGKSLCYNLPVLHHLLDDPRARALYLFPAKALTHDQATALQTFITAAGPPTQSPHHPVSVATYDGDTPASVRATIRRQAHILLTNPDMLHVAILPHHTKWADFFSRLKFVVIDEMHTYRGVFGSHVANVLRRLKRIAHFYGANPQFILTSATIANPTDFAERLIEAPTVLIDNDGSAAGPKHFLIYNPPIVDPKLGLRRSSLQESVRLGQELLRENIQTIIFGRTRRTVEMLLTYLRNSATAIPDRTRLPSPQPSPTGRGSFTSPPVGGIKGRGLATNNQSPNLPVSKSPNLPTIRAYRSGFLPRRRREIEQGLRQGDVRAVVATSALELGIDIGRLDAAILTGYPGAIAATWQQAGRAGRQREASVAILVASANPLDQFLAHHPDYFFERSPEQALIDPDNLLILLQHLRCAAFELPFMRNAPFGRVPPDRLTEFLDFLQKTGELHPSGEKYFWMADHYPAQQVSLRSASPDTVKLQVQQEDDRWITIGEVDQASATWMVHPKAIYLHEGQSYQVDSLDLGRNIAELRPVKVDYYTEPVRDTLVQLVEQRRQTQVEGAIKTYGEILVTTRITGYQQMQWFTHQRLGSGEVDLPPHELHTAGYWLALRPETVQSLRDRGLWSNDPNDYGPNWPAQRNQARNRDGYRCRMCGLPEQGGQHDVHHKIPFRRFGNHVEANQLSNLITLCRPCHRRAETAVRMRSGLAGLAQALGQLAPLFLMCDTHDLGVHADPQSPLAGGQPTIVIYDLVPAGLGFSERLFELHHNLIAHAHELVSRCPCLEGCPSCVGPAGEEGVGGKKETLGILELL